MGLLKPQSEPVLARNRFKNVVFDLAVNYRKTYGVEIKLPLPSEKVKLSVVVPVYNEAAVIRKCLEALNRQTNLNFEAIFVDNRCTDKSVEIINEFAKNEAKYKIYVIFEEKAGPGNARRAGMDQAAIRQSQNSGIKYIAGTDGDSIPCETWVDDIHNGFTRGNFDLIAGDVEYFWDIQKNEHEKLRFYDFMRAITSKIGRPRVRGLNFAIKSEVYMRVGGVVQPYTDDGKIKTGEEGSLIQGVENSGGKIGHISSVVKGDPRRLILNIKEGKNAGLSLFNNSEMTNARSGEGNNLDGVTSEDVDLFIERRLKGIFRKDLVFLYKNEVRRGLYWNRVKVFLGTRSVEFANDMDCGVEDLDVLWEKYRKDFISNLVKIGRTY